MSTDKTPVTGSPYFGIVVAALLAMMVGNFVEDFLPTSTKDTWTGFFLEGAIAIGLFGIALVVLGAIFKNKNSRD